MQLKEKVLKASGERNAVKLDRLRVAVCDDVRCLNGFRGPGATTWYKSRAIAGKAALLSLYQLSRVTIAQSANVSTSPARAEPFSALSF